MRDKKKGERGWKKEILSNLISCIIYHNYVLTGFFMSKNKSEWHGGAHL